MATVASWLAYATKELTGKDNASARLDSLLLLEQVLTRDRALLLAHPELTLSSEDETRLTSLLARRKQHEPLAYLRGYQEFYGRRFAVDKRVLVPRPESEAMIDLLLAANAKSPIASIVDVGTGSGTLAITARCELPSAQVIASDIDANCLELTALNAASLNAAITCVVSDLLADIPFDSLGTVLLANLPYVPNDYAVSAATAYEPASALYAGPDGMDLYRQLWLEVADRPAITQVITEALPEQHAALEKLATNCGMHLAASTAFVQHFTR